MGFFFCMYVYHLHAVSTKARRGQKIPWNWSIFRLCSTMWALGTQPEPSAKHPVLLSTEPSFQFQFLFFSPNFLLICGYMCGFFLTFLCLGFSTSKVVGRSYKIDSKLRVPSLTLWKGQVGAPCSELLGKLANVGVWSTPCYRACSPEHQASEENPGYKVCMIP